MSDVLVEIDDPVAVITLHRPERLNALTYPMLRELRRVVDAAAADPAVVGIVITGSGRGFCSGLDAEALQATAALGTGARDVAAPPAQGAAPDEAPGLFTYLLSVPKPVIAAVNGVAAGGGLVLAVMSDVRIASTDASFTTIFNKRGLVAEHGTSWIMPRLLGPGRALDLLWSSRRIDADEALRCGLVEYVCPPDELVARSCDYIRALADSISPAAMADTKAMVYRHLGFGWPEALRDADDLQWKAFERPDVVEGAAALIEKRSPRFPRLGA